MTPSNDNPVPIKAAISIKEMASLVGLSRQRFMQLVKVGVFPPPLKDEVTGRPYFTDEMQSQCVDVRRRNCGINGRVVIFYSRRISTLRPVGQPKAMKQKKRQSSNQHPAIVAGLHELGLTSATNEQVANAMNSIYPNGTAGAEVGEVIRAVFLQLRGKNSAENVGRKE